MKKYNLFLDDERYPSDAFYLTGDIRYNKLEWVIARSYDEFVSIVTKNGLPEMVSFDHDLADVHYEGVPDYNTMEKTGYHCAKWLVQYCIDQKLEPPTYNIHSQNNVGAVNIESEFHTYRKAKRLGII